MATNDQKQKRVDVDTSLHAELKGYAGLNGHNLGTLVNECLRIGFDEFKARAEKATAA